jgi:hypothetical protein
MLTRSSVTWLIHRLAVMSPAELAWRAGSVLRSALDRLGHRLTGRWPRMELAPAAKFRFMVSESAWLFVPPVTVPTAVGGRLLEGQVPVFEHWAAWADDPGFWHTDVLSGATWPCDARQQPNYRPGNPTGDVRVVWELNRLQHLFSLATIASQEPLSSVAALTQIQNQVASWLRANPFPGGVQHVSAMEEALRVIALLHTFDLVRNSAVAQTRETFLVIFLSHGWDIERKLSLHSSAGNHTIAEAVGLLYLGLLFPEHQRAQRWIALGRDLLARESDRQVRPDGGPLEQATWYLLFIADLMGLAQLLLSHTGQPPIARMDAALVRARQFLGQLADIPAQLPRIGDADDGYALSPHLRISWPSSPVQRCHVTFPDTGVTVASFDGTDQLLFLHKDLGMAPNYGHGHSDALAIAWRWRGQEVLVDPGTYLYGGPAHWREYFRSAFAHNTAVVNNVDPIDQSGPFMWRSSYRSRVIFSKLDKELVSILALSDGYGRQGFTHWRGILYAKDRYLAIWDGMQGLPLNAQATLRWHVGGTMHSAADGAFDLAIAKDHSIRILPPSGSICTVRKAETNPVRGWRAPTYTSLQPSQTLECVLPATHSADAVTIFELGAEHAVGIEFREWLAECRERLADAGTTA